MPLTRKTPQKISHRFGDLPTKIPDLAFCLFVSDQRLISAFDWGIVHDSMCFQPQLASQHPKLASFNSFSIILFSSVSKVTI